MALSDVPMPLPSDCPHLHASATIPACLGHARLPAGLERFAESGHAAADGRRLVWSAEDGKYRVRSVAMLQKAMTSPSRSADLTRELLKHSLEEKGFDRYLVK